MGIRTLKWRLDKMIEGIVLYCVFGVILWVYFTQHVILIRMGIIEGNSFSILGNTSPVVVGFILAVIWPVSGAFFLVRAVSNWIVKQYICSR